MVECGCRIGIIDNDVRALRSMEKSCNKYLANVKLIRTFVSGIEALQHRESVDLWLVDMSMEGMSGREFCWKLRADGSLIPVLGVTSFSLERYHDVAVCAGMQGIEDKSDDASIMCAIEKLISGQVFKGFESPSMARRRIRQEAKEKIDLSPREKETLILMSHGMLDIEVADYMGISEATVRKHMQHVLEKLGLKTSRQAVVYWLSKSQ